MTNRPEIVCICGSAKFMTEMHAANRELTFEGVIVVAPTEADESPTGAEGLAGRSSSAQDRPR